MILDLSNPKVQDFVFGVVDNLMTNYPEIAYIKWDANMSVQNHGSQYLTKDNQSHMYIEFHRGFEKICQRIRAKYPDLTIQACASGGGRANYGVLPYFDEFWVSDNTDALQRIYMQWGTSYFFPAIAMASHISAAPNHQTFRVIPLKYRIDVAMSGRLGMEIQPKNMTEEEKQAAVKDFALTKGLAVALLAGVMSACFNLGLEAGSPISELVRSHGANELFVLNPVILLVTTGGFLTNAIYCIYQNGRNHTGKEYFSVSAGVLWNNVLFCALAGVLWYSQFFGLGMGKSYFSDSPVMLAFSWSILMSLNVIFSNVWGILLKEWKGVDRRTIVVLITGMCILILSLLYPNIV